MRKVVDIFVLSCSLCLLQASCGHDVLRPIDVDADGAEQIPEQAVIPVKAFKVVTTSSLVREDSCDKTTTTYIICAEEGEYMYVLDGCGRMESLPVDDPEANGICD